MGRPKGSKNKPKTSGTKPGKIRYTVTVSVDATFEVTLPHSKDPHQYFKDKKEELVRKVKRAKVQPETAQVKRYEW